MGIEKMALYLTRQNFLPRNRELHKQEEEEEGKGGNLKLKLGPNQINTNPRLLEKLIDYSLIGTDPALIAITALSRQQRLGGGRRRRRGRKWNSEPVIGIGVVVTEELGEEKNERRHLMEMER
ncbi:unnamed protein product [Citrullus colocynthis]|uniref:Uncharacterized protein n=1 Tax=Citrullus colocynthis TaxID=252529 RepID=A0ABP0YT10_9ROSI